MTFSSRTPGDISPNPIAKALESLQGQAILDLTESNPTRCGFDYPSNLFASLASPASLHYEPFPFGLPKARQAVADYLKAKGQSVDPDQVVLTASTSEAYSYLFKLLGDSGSAFLVPTPGYPLLEHLLRMEGMEMISYPFQMAENWPVDWEETRQAAISICRGLIVVNPHNPTGAFLSDRDQKLLGNICQKNQLAYISDEVFAEFAYPGQVFKPWVPKSTLSFRLGGLSKSLGLPQLKLSWIVLDGPEDRVQECRERLELIADTYLSVNTPVQIALPDLLAFAPAFQKQLLERVLSNREFIEKRLRGLTQSHLWPAQGGWYILLEIRKKGAQDEEIILDILKKHKVLVQPGSFYDFPKGCFLILSLLPPEEVFQEGADRIQKYLENNL